ncbi:MAG: hypothetical protein IPL32_20320 [Chloracidobacterium sp.]|nr:hypothetical protein [Chloracidobacterium sp.]MBK8468167.1 hypothetical protein [Chloracidobacterium sp.]
MDILIHVAYIGVIAVLSSAVALLAWRKRVWKRRAIAENPGFWHAFRAAIADETNLPKPPKGKDDWPNRIEVKDK